MTAYTPQLTAQHLERLHWHSVCTVRVWRSAARRPSGTWMLRGFNFVLDIRLHQRDSELGTPGYNPETLHGLKCLVFLLPMIGRSKFPAARCSEPQRPCWKKECCARARTRAVPQAREFARPRQACALLEGTLRGPACQ
jgi:hypothetical protein